MDTVRNYFGITFLTCMVGISLLHAAEGGLTLKLSIPEDGPAAFLFLASDGGRVDVSAVRGVRELGGLEISDADEELASIALETARAPLITAKEADLMNQRLYALTVSSQNNRRVVTRWTQQLIKFLTSKERKE